MRWALVAFGLSTAISITLAPDFARSQSLLPIGNWSCIKDAKQSLTMTFDDGALRVNNIIVKAAEATLLQPAGLKLSATALNYGEKKAFVSLEIVGFTAPGAETMPTFALSGSPAFGFVEPQNSQDMSRSTLAPLDSLDKSARICLRVSVHYDD